MSSSRGPYFSRSAKPERVARHGSRRARLFTAKPVLGAPLDVDDELSEHGVPPQLAYHVERAQKASDAPEKLRANAELGYKAAAVGDACARGTTSRRRRRRPRTRRRARPSSCATSR